jgi:hypothetical protein
VEVGVKLYLLLLAIAGGFTFAGMVILMTAGWPAGEVLLQHNVWP